MTSKTRDAEVGGGLQSGGLQTSGAYYTVWLQREDWPQCTHLFQFITSTNSTVGVGYPGLRNFQVAPERPVRHVVKQRQLFGVCL